MTTIAFDTHKAIKLLISQGIAPAQAEVFVDVVRDSRKADLDNLVTKGDMDATLAALEIRMMNARREDMRWILGLFLAVIGLLVTILLKLH